MTKALPQTLPSIIIVVMMMFNFNTLHAQGSVPADVASIVSMKLEDGQKKLSSFGYEVCGSSLMGKKQDWYNESTKTCITVKFDKKKQINSVVLNPATSECQRKLEASRAVWEKYHDGQAPVNTPKIDEERKKLANQGFRVSYWVDQISPGRSSEYWVNDTTKKTMLIVWEVQDNKWATTTSTDYQYGKNPAPAKK